MEEEEEEAFIATHSPVVFAAIFGLLLSLAPSCAVSLRIGCGRMASPCHSPHAVFKYDEGEQDCIFQEKATREASSKWRARVLTTEDCQQLEKSGTIRPISLPDDLQETENVRLWCAALRLCGHDLRRVYALQAIQADRMPEALLRYIARNEYGHMMPIPCFVSTCSARRVGVLAQICLARTFPLWTGGQRIFFFKTEQEMDADSENGSVLTDFLREQLGGTSFPEPLLSQWCADVIHWRRHLTEMHHSSIPVQALLDSQKAFIVSFDVHSLQSLFGCYARALETYTVLTRAAMEKAFRGSRPSSVFAEKLFLAILLGLDKFLESYQGEDGCALRSVLQAAAMVTIECFAEQDAKTRQQGEVRNINKVIKGDKVVKRIKEKTPVTTLLSNGNLRRPLSTC